MNDEQERRGGKHPADRVTDALVFNATAQQNVNDLGASVGSAIRATGFVTQEFWAPMARV